MALQRSNICIVDGLAKTSTTLSTDVTKRTSKAPSVTFSRAKWKSTSTCLVRASNTGLAVKNAGPKLLHHRTRGLGRGTSSSRRSDWSSPSSPSSPMRSSCHHKDYQLFLAHRPGVASTWLCQPRYCLLPEGHTAGLFHCPRMSHASVLHYSPVQGTMPSAQRMNQPYFSVSPPWSGVYRVYVVSPDIIILIFWLPCCLHCSDIFIETLSRQSITNRLHIGRIGVVIRQIPLCDENQSLSYF